MCDVDNTIDWFLLSIGSVYSLANIEHILGVIILVIQLIWLTLKLTLKIVKAAKEKKSLSETLDDIGSDIENIADLTGTIKHRSTKDE